MRNLLIGIFFVLCLWACESSGDKYRIEGSLPSTRYDGEWIYLVPTQNATIETIDSTRIQDGKFIFEGKGEEMKILRMRILLRLDFQELLVATEPGTITARIDSVSSASGTPQNDALQQWKENKERTDRQYHALWMELKESAPDDSIRILHVRDSLRMDTRAANYAFLKEEIQHTVGKFLYPLIKQSLTEEQQKELDGETMEK